jgi:hypothetical protein
MLRIHLDLESIDCYGWKKIQIFELNISKFFANLVSRIRDPEWRKNSDPGWKNPDPGWKNPDPGSGIKISDPQHRCLQYRTALDAGIYLLNFKFLYCRTVLAPWWQVPLISQ